VSRRIDWEAVREEYMRAGDEVTLKSLASDHGISPVALARHAESESWEFLQARWRVHMGRPQKTDILKRTREEWDKECKEAFAKLEECRKTELKARHEDHK
jgi:hypothetical protein